MSQTEFDKEAAMRVLAVLPERPKRHEPLPVSSATGGLVDVLTWEDLRNIEAEEDFERLRRSS